MSPPCSRPVRAAHGSESVLRLNYRFLAVFAARLFAGRFEVLRAVGFATI
jgi:hypothetical protein